MPKETVLVVDDEEHARNAVSRLLTSNGYIVHALASGEEAIDYAASHTFDVLLSDFRMPGLDGLTTVRVVRKLNPQVVAIIMTGNTSIDLAVQSLNLGVHGFVVKPFHGYELLSTIERTIERQNLIRENIKMRALVNVFEATEALITAHAGDRNESRLFRLTLEFALRETRANDAALFMLADNKLEAVGLASKEMVEGVDTPSFEERLGLLKKPLPPQSPAQTDADTYKAVLDDGPVQIYLQPELADFVVHHVDGWPRMLEIAQQALDKSTSLFLVDNQPSDLEAGGLIPTQQESCVLAIPMQVQGRKVGVLTVRRRKTENTFSEVDLQTAAILAGQAAIAIDNSRLLLRLVHIEALREADRLRSEFVSTVSHELRTPLTSIKGYATTLLRPGVKWHEATAQEYLNIISEECDKLMHLIDNILEVSKIEAGVLQVYPEPLQIQDTLDYAVIEAQRRSPEAIIEVNKPAQVLPLVVADSQRIIQVLRNLLSNAIKYSPSPAQINLKVSTPFTDKTLTDNSKLEFIQISVSDNGLGLSSEQQMHVFERFYRVDSSSTRQTEGTGLGLAICKGIIEAHGGRIWVESDGAGQGSTFAFTLPLLAEQVPEL